eukprot:1162058-Pelagomonas_calceolata.AAC.2
MHKLVKAMKSQYTHLREEHEWSNLTIILAVLAIPVVVGACLVHPEQAAVPSYSAGLYRHYPIHDLDVPISTKQYLNPIHDLDVPISNKQYLNPIHDLDAPISTKQYLYPIHDLDVPISSKQYLNPIHDLAMPNLCPIFAHTVLNK